MKNKINKLSLLDATFLKMNAKSIPDLKKLRDGLIEPNTQARKRFLDVLKGKLLPETQWERAFLHWTEMNEPELSKYISENMEDNKKKNYVNKSSIFINSASRNKNKKISKKLKEIEIEETHRKSGYYKKTIKIVSGGLPSLGKRR